MYKVVPSPRRGRHGDQKKHDQKKHGHKKNDQKQRGLTAAYDAPFPGRGSQKIPAEGLQEHSTLVAEGCLSASAPSAKKRRRGTRAQSGIQNGTRAQSDIQK